MNRPIKVLVVDDSAWMRKLISEIIDTIEEMEVVGKARNGEVALKLIETIKPDLITLDLEMPMMNGLETLRELEKQERDTLKVIVISSQYDQMKTMEALESGAEDFIRKPVNIQKTYATFKKELEQKIWDLFETDRNEKMSSLERDTALEKESIQKLLPRKLSAIVIGASTGGPKALTRLVKKLPKTLAVPVFIVQHMPEGFTASFAERLNQLASVPVTEAQEGMPIEAGTVYLAPGGFHMVLKDRSIRLTKEKKLHGVRPAVDLLFASAAQIYGEGLVGVILTGMGRDGTEGCREVQLHGGYTLAQNRETSVIYGMPRNAIENGVINQIADLDKIGICLNRMADSINEAKL